MIACATAIAKKNFKVHVSHIASHVGSMPSVCSWVSK